MKKEAAEPAGIRYLGRMGNPASNDHGLWETGQVRPIGNGEGEIPRSAADGYVASNHFEFVYANKEN